MKNKSLFTVTIPQYLREIQLSKAQRTLYYEWDGNDIRAKATKTSKGKTLLKKFIKNDYKKLDSIQPWMLKDRYNIAVVKDKKIIGHTRVEKGTKPLSLLLTLASLGRLSIGVKNDIKCLVYDKELKCLIVANPTKAGKPKTLIINGQDFYSGKVREHVRGKVVREIKESFLPYVKDIPIIDIKNYPLKVELEVHDTVKNIFDTRNKDIFGTRWDIGNRSFPYGKTFMDLISTGRTGEKNSNGNYKQFFEPKIIDDHRLFITKEPLSGEFYPLEGDDDTNRKLVFTFSVDRKASIKQNNFYKQFHKWK